MSDQRQQGLSDEEWVKEYGASGNPPRGYVKQLHAGTDDRARDNDIVDAALGIAESGKRAPDTLLRRR